MSANGVSRPTKIVNAKNKETNNVTKIIDTGVEKDQAMVSAKVDKGAKHEPKASPDILPKEENEQLPSELGEGQRILDTLWLGESLGSEYEYFATEVRGEYEYEGEGHDEEYHNDEAEIEEVPLRPRIPARPGVCARLPVPTYNPELDVFLMVRRKKTTIFIDAKEDTEVLELKRMIAGITKVMPEAQKLFRDNNELDEKKKISDYGLNAGTAKPQLPATIALVFKDDNGEWERIDMAPLSQPPELPEVMRQQEPSNAEAS